ncbi:MAG TPA: DUF3526 domain-containing protein [Planctomicrobium sp.]|nr:DUF3526 domain-containing protein [Planctomicrobium sp.]
MELRTIGIIAVNELRQWSRHRWLLVALLLFLLLETMVCWRTFQEFREQRLSLRDQQQSAREAWLSQTTTNAHMATHRGTTLFKVPSPLACFDPGVDPALGTSLHIEAHRPGETTPPPTDAQISLLKFEASTPAVLMQMVFPLIVILLSHTGISREREQGTQRLIQSLGMRWPTWICGKLLAIGTVNTVALLPVAGVFVVAALLPDFRSEMRFSNQIVRSSAIVGTLWLYLLGWGALSLGISARASSSRAALILLLLLWSGWTVILPRIALDVAQSQVPLPASEDIRDRQRKVLGQSDAGSSELKRRLDALQQRLLKEHGVERLRDLPVSFAGAKMMEIEKYTDEQFERIQADVNTRFARQDRIVEWFEFFSPYLAIRAVSMAFSGTDRRHHEAFLGAAEEYRRNLVRTMNLADMQNRQPGNSPEEKRAFWGQVPPFQYVFPEGALVAQVAAWSLTMLLVWTGIAFILALIPPLQRTGKEKAAKRGKAWIPNATEWNLALSDPAFRLTLTILALLTVFACQPGLHQFHVRQERSLEARNETARRILESVFSPEVDLNAIRGEEGAGFSLQEAQDLKLAARSPDLLSHYDGLWWTWMPPSPLAVLAIGESTAWPDRYRVSASSRTETLRRDILENPFHSRIGPFDLTLFVAAILPLGILVLTHGLISSEREQGTLALLISQNVSPFRLFWRRSLIRVSAAVLVIVIMTFIVCQIQGCNLAQAHVAIPFMLWGICLFLYAMFWGMLALAVNTFGGSTSTNAIWLLLCWIGLVLVIPAISARLVSNEHPVSIPAVLAQKEREILSECKKSSDSLMTSPLPGESAEALVSMTPQQQEMLRYWRVHDEAAKRFQEVLRDEFDQYRSRDTSLSAWAWLSPVVAWRQATVHLAGTSLSDAATFAEQTSHFQMNSISFFQPYSVSERELNLADIQQIPRFQPAPFEHSAREWERIQLLLALLFWNGLLWLVAAYRCRRGIDVK